MDNKNMGKICVIFFGLVVLGPNVCFSGLFKFSNIKYEALFRVKQYATPENQLIRVRNWTDPIAKKYNHVILDFVGMVQQYGYPAEAHYLRTPDGYNLEFHRVPGTPTNPKRPGKAVVYLQHGILDSSDCFVLRGPGKSLAFVLADAGYDVWVGNVRGNSYGKSHVSLSPSNPDFYRFSFHEMALIDVPLMIDYILKRTKEPSLTYIGHSMGSTISYVLLSSKPEYNEKIKPVISLSPIAYWNRGVPELFEIFIKHEKEVTKFLMHSRIHAAFPQGFLNVLAAQTCNISSILQPTCIRFMNILIGENINLFDKKSFSNILYHFPSGTSLQTLYHFSQNIATGQFRAYDYGNEVVNYAMHRSPVPPTYDLTRITTPVALIYGEGDAVLIKENLQELLERLPNVVACEPVSNKKFNHMDFLYAKHAKRILYDRVLQIISRYSLRGTSNEIDTNDNEM